MFIQEKIDNMNQRFHSLENVSEIVIWGAGIHTLKLFERTNLLSYNITNIVDVDERKQGKLYFGFCIKSPYVIEWKKVSMVVVSVFGKDEQIIRTLLSELKYLGNIMVLYEKNEIIPFYELYDNERPQIYAGDYECWNDAAKVCKGYGDKAILTKVAASIDKVLSGDAEWERDSVLFYTQKFVYRICAAILRCALQNGNLGVKVLDIGGSLGSTYFQNKKYLTGVHNLQYVVAEQKGFADYGSRKLANGTLKFIDSNDEYDALGKVDIVLLSASLQYIYPYKDIISKILKIEPRYIILDRVLISERMRICKQTVPKEIYIGSYPVIIFSEDEICKYFMDSYELIEKDISSVPEEAYFADGKADSKYYVFERIQK